MSIEAVYWRHGRSYIYAAESLRDAQSYLADGEEHRRLVGIGVFTDGEPRLAHDHRPPDETTAANMTRWYEEAKWFAGKAKEEA